MSTTQHPGLTIATLLAIPLLFLTHVIVQSEVAETCALLVIASLILFCFFRTRSIAHQRMARAALRFYLATFASITFWFLLNVIRVVTYDDAVEARNTFAAHTYWPVVETQDYLQWVIIFSAVACVVTAITALITKLRSPKLTHV